MTHPSPNPFGDAAPDTDQVGLAVRAVAAGWMAAVALLAVVTYVAGSYASQSGALTIKDVQPDDPQVNVMVYGVMFSLTVAFLLAWVLMRPVASSFRRLGLSMVAVLGGFLIAMLSTFLVRQLAGAMSLLVLAAVAALGAWHLARRARALA